MFGSGMLNLQSDDSTTFRRLVPPIEAPHPGTIVGIDAEFVALQQEEINMTADGTRETIRPSRLGLARVSVLRGTGQDADLPFIDDYIAMQEPVIDYLTEFSGIRPGDLERGSSLHMLVSLRVAYKKLWLLLNLGCIFVGHGLIKDFRTINIHIPKNQVIDTVELFHIKSRGRKISLRFLAWILLHEDIQSGMHDSIEDARTALRLWRKYLEYTDAGVLEQQLDFIYKEGMKYKFKVPSEQKSGGGLGVAEHATPGRGTPEPSTRPGSSMAGDTGDAGTPGRFGGVRGAGAFGGSPLR
jgi:PAB-dependent poly(A)-specific ribonuclease subunit 2